MKVGLIGAGSWGRNLARVLYELGALGAVAELRPEVRNQLKVLYPDVPLYSDHLALLEADFPAVVIATPAPTHYTLAKEALKSGKHTFVEKPLTLKVSEAEELVAIARREDRILMVGHLLLYQSAVRWIKDFLDSGNLGEIWGLHQERLKLGRVRTVENVLWSFGVHDIAVFLYLVGRPPERVIAQGQAVLQPGIEDDVYLHLEFPDGIQAHLHSSWLWPEKRRRLTVIGSRGMLVFDELYQKVVLHHKGVNPDLTDWDEGDELAFQGRGEPLKLEMEHFLNCIKEGKRPLSDGESALPVIKVLEEATRQLSEGG